MRISSSRLCKVACKISSSTCASRSASWTLRSWSSLTARPAMLTASAMMDTLAPIACKNFASSACAAEVQPPTGFNFGGGNLSPPPAANPSFRVSSAMQRSISMEAARTSGGASEESSTFCKWIASLCASLFACLGAALADSMSASRNMSQCLLESTSLCVSSNSGG